MTAQTRSGATDMLQEALNCMAQANGFSSRLAP
jgi:hypothetical protein